MSVKGLPIVPGQFWVSVSARNMQGKLVFPPAHALVHSLSMLHASQEPVVDMMRERFVDRLGAGEFALEVNVRHVCGEGASYE